MITVNAKGFRPMLDWDPLQGNNITKYRVDAGCPKCHHLVTGLSLHDPPPPESLHSAQCGKCEFHFMVKIPWYDVAAEKEKMRYHAAVVKVQNRHGLV